jgi:hypothetical protein
MSDEKTDSKKVKMNISLSPKLAAALRRHAFETTGQMRGVSDVAETAIREYLEGKGVVINEEQK